MFYINAYFEARRETYCIGLLAVSRNHDWTGYLRGQYSRVAISFLQQVFPSPQYAGYWACYTMAEFYE